jgi:hypothetical protein
VWALLTLALVALAIILAVRALLYDACTRSFERSPRSVVSTYVEAISQGNLPVAQECWEHEAFYDLEAGCSEICLAAASGAQYDVQAITLGERQAAADGHAHMAVAVSVACAADGETHSGEILLDSARPDVPWTHWAIIHSTVGGTIAEPWCR